MSSASDRPVRDRPPTSRPPFPSTSTNGTNYTGSMSSTAPVLRTQVSSDSATRVQFTETSRNNNADIAINPRPALTLQVGTGDNTDYHSNGFSEANVKRKKSLVRPEREKVDQNNRLFNYRNHAAVMEMEGRGYAGYSGNNGTTRAHLEYDDIVPNPAFQDSTNLRRGKSILAREEGMANESGLSMFKRATTLRRANTNGRPRGNSLLSEKKRLATKPQPLGPWMLFCLAVTMCCPSPLLKCCGESYRISYVSL